jgi:hypothetical protein
MPLQKASRPTTAIAAREPRRSAWRQDRKAIANLKPNQASLRLTTAARQIEVVHHGTAAGVESWHVVFSEGGNKKSRQSVANFATKCEAIGQLGFLSQKFGARIVGRGAPR